MRKVALLSAMLLWFPAVLTGGPGATIPIKPGLWEITRKPGGPPPPLPAGMTPEQRAKYGAMLKALASRTIVARMCITKEDLKHVSFAVKKQEGSVTCTNSSDVSPDGKTILNKRECKDSCGRTTDKDSETIHILDPEHVSGSSKSQNVSAIVSCDESLDSYQVNSTFSAKWLPEACPRPNYFEIERPGAKH